MDMGPARCTLKVRGLDCPTEVAALRSALAEAPGVIALAFDTLGGTMTVDYRPGEAEPEGLVRLVQDRAGMRSEVIGAAEGAREPRWYLDPRWAATLASGSALAFGVLAGAVGWRPLVSTAAFAAAVAFGGFNLVPKAARALRRLRPDIHALMGLAVVGAVALGQWDEAATVAFLFGLSEALEALSLERARRAVRSLLEVAPETAEVVGACGGAHRVDARAVKAGDRVRIRAGERIPVDGNVVEGRSAVDQRSITGESVPIGRGPGDEVFAGTVNGEGALEVEATRPLGDAVVTRIVEGVRAAQAGRTPAERSIERFASWYTPWVVALALGVATLPPLIGPMVGGSAGWRTWIHRGLVVLVTACPCALVISTPVAVVSALAAAARRGVLIKGGNTWRRSAGCACWRSTRRGR